MRSVLLVALLVSQLGFMHTLAKGGTIASAEIEHFYHAQRAKYNWYYRLVFLATSGMTQHAVQRHCLQKANRCSIEEMQAAVHQEMRKIGERASDVATYGIAISCIILSAYAGAKFNVFLAKHNISQAARDFVSVFIPIITGIGVFSIGAPLWDRANSFVRRWAFISGQFSSQRDYPARPELEELWVQMQKYYSLNAQMSRNTLSAFLVLASPSLREAREALEKKRDDYAAAQLAKVMVQMRYLYADIPPDNAFIAFSVRSYVYGIELDEALLQEVKRIAVALDPINTSESYYDLIIKSWFNAHVLELEEQN